jgi:hypothetical protein
MFCPQCGVQAEQQTKFCRSCGLKLSDHAQLLPRTREAETRQMSPEQAERELRLLKGTKGLVISSAFLPLSFLLAFLVFMISIELGGSQRGPLMAISCTLVLLLFASFFVGSRGLFNLIRSEFFKTFKKRLIRAEAILLDQPNSTSNLETPSETNRISIPIERGSIVEHTTHELQSAASNSGKIN